MYTTDEIDNLKYTQLSEKMKKELARYQPMETRRGNKIIDIAYFKEPDGSYGVDLTIFDYNGNTIHLYHLKPDELPISDQFYLSLINTLEENIKYYVRS